MTNETTIAGRTVQRLGYGTMRLTGPHIFGPPADPDECIRVLRHAIDSGVRILDTAWYYGPDVSEELIRTALHPYPEDLVLVTKLGGARDDKGGWYEASSPAELKQGAETDLRLLGVESVPVAHLRVFSPRDVSQKFQDSLGAMVELQQAGKIERIGLSNIGAAQLDLALATTAIETVSNSYGPLQRKDDPLLDRCGAEGIHYLPFFPLASGQSHADETLGAVAKRHDATASQIAIAWLLHRAPHVVPIPGTSTVAHLKENLAAADISLSREDLDEIDTAAQLARVLP